MTTYIVLINWTEQGAKNVRDSPKRLDAAKKLLGDMGGSFKAFYLTMGECDMVAVVEAPDDAVLARFSLMLASGRQRQDADAQGFPGSSPIARSSPRSDRHCSGRAGPAGPEPFSFART